MSMQENLPAAPPRGRAHGVVYAHRKRKNDFAQLCYAEMKEVVEFWMSIVRDEQRPLDERLQVADRIVNRAVGAVPKPAAEEGDSEGGNVGVHHTYNVRWLPPDPNDHSVVIEHE